MSGLQKASLTEITPDDQATPVGDPVDVQFNPATMKIQITNSNEGGQSRGRQAQQYLGSSSTTMTVDLIFDTSDEGTTDSPRSVRERTAILEKYVIPASTSSNKQAPPKLRFQWGPFVIDGLLDSISIDIDHFAADGTPLRAKVPLSLKEQDKKYEFGVTGPSANDQSAPPPGDPPPGQPGSGAGPSTQSGTAIAGETAADFAVRMGLDASAWRGLDFGASASLSLDAGLEVGFSADLSISAGLGVTAGFEAGVSASLEASVGLDVGASIGISASASFSADVSAGFSLSAAGGVSAAIDQVKIASASAAVQQTAQAFGQTLPAAATSATRTSSASTSAPLTSSSPAASATPAAKAAAAPVAVSPAAALSPAPAARLGPPDQQRMPLTQSGLPSASQQAAAPPAPSLPRVDDRAASFGFGVPLRSQVAVAASQRADLAQGAATLRSQVGSGDPPITSNPAIPPWIALPASEFVVDTPGKLQLKKRLSPSCGCSGRCHCKGRARKEYA